MAKPGVALSNSVDDLDDLVYMSDAEEIKKPMAHIEPGMIPESKNLYPGEKDDHGRFTSTDKIPNDLPEPEETEETTRYALLIRNNKCYDGRKSLSIASIVVQSPLLKRVLCWVLKDYPSMAPGLDRLEVVSPFRPFVHRWQRLTDALNNEQDPEIKSHIQLFYDALKKELEVTLEARDDFIAHKTITFNSLWMIFEPGDVVFMNHNKRPVAAKLKTGGAFQGRHEDLYRLECDMIYGNGNVFGWGHPRFDIPEFDGMTKITELITYPLKYHPKADKIKKQLIENGRAYERFMGFHHVQYQGIALDMNQPYYVDSRIIIDPDAYKCFNPDYDVKLDPLRKTVLDDLNHIVVAAEDSEHTDGSSDEGGNKEAQNGQAKKKALSELTEDQLLVCGSSIKGYSLRNKRWLDFFVDCIKEIEWDEHAWDNVVLENDAKDLIFDMTNGHRHKHKGLQSKGLNIFLSGPTGVGKTFAVESLAEALRAPLFHATPADVDLDAKCPDLESPFTDILEMCGRWNAILLFDQAQEALDNDPDEKQGREYPLLLDALESHSAVLFVTCNESAGDCMDGRLQSRFHVCLQLPELTSATRGQIWQKCLESHKDMTFFSNPATLAHWTLNGREIANAVVAAKTLATNGVLEIKHLERVVPAGRRVVPIADDPWDFPLKKGKKKKSKKAAVEGERSHTDIGEIIEEPPKVDEDAWAGWGFGPKNKEKEKAEVRVEPEKAPEVAPKLQDDDWGNWVIKMRDRQPKKPSDEAALPPPAPPAPPVEAKVPAKDKTELDDIWGSFGAKKSKKSKKAVPNEPDPVSASIGEGSREAVTAPPEVDDWSFWASSKKEKKKKKGAVVDEVPLVVEAHISEARGITSCAPPALSCVGCRTCVEYEPVREGRYCKRCGTREGNFKIVCEPCAMTKGYNQFALRNVPCEVCGNLNP